MSNYGAGDYFRAGDNYAAGGLSLKGIIRTVGKVAGTVFKATPAGQAFATAKALLSSPRKPSTLAIAPISQPIDYSGGGMDVDVPADVGIPSMTNAYMYDERGRRRGDTGRKGHFKKDGTWTNRARPRMNAGNMKALRRASRRAQSFLRATRSAVRYFQPKAKKGKAYVSFRKRAK